jgi:Arc-like DNA binding domain
MEKNSTAERALVHTHVPRAVRDELRSVARENHRSLAGEVRRAIAEHLQRERPEPKEEN